MDPDVLRDHLTKLHEELRTAPRAAPDSSRLLGELMEDIRQLLARTAAGDAAPAATAAVSATSTRRADDTAASPAPPSAGTASRTSDVDSSLTGRLEKIALLFEVDHPTLAASSRRLIDILGKVGL